MYAVAISPMATGSRRLIHEVKKSAAQATKSSQKAAPVNIHMLGSSAMHSDSAYPSSIYDTPAC